MDDPSTASNCGSGLAFVLAFSSTHAALVALKKLEARKPHLIPTPSGITAGCGMSLKFAANDEVQALEIMGEAYLDEGQASLYLSNEGCYRLIWGDRLSSQ